MLLQNGAILIADAHENEQRKGFWEFLQALKKGKISTPQLILMGDIFDLLIGEISATHEFAKPYIELLEELALKIEIIYLE
ncbi:UDP-2,3-diacylglucosamine diphosphatase, partial [Campylobacter jejuni]